MQPERIDLNALVGGTVKLLKRVIGENIEITVDFSDDAAPVLADPVQLEVGDHQPRHQCPGCYAERRRLRIAAGRNVLDADYAAANPEVTPGEYAVIEVTDNGSGMPPEVVGRIFEPFYTTKGRDKGTGLGLEHGVRLSEAVRRPRQRLQ